jgi:hypothetical protein
MVLAEIEHARQRREPKLRDVLPQIELRAHLDHRVLSRLQHETIRTGGARRIEQRIQTQFARLRIGSLDPELVNRGNSSPDMSAVSIARPRADRP